MYKFNNCNFKDVYPLTCATIGEARRIASGMLHPVVKIGKQYFFGNLKSLKFLAKEKGGGIKRVKY